MMSKAARRSWTQTEVRLLWKHLFCLAYEHANSVLTDKTFPDAGCLSDMTIVMLTTADGKASGKNMGYYCVLFLCNLESIRAILILRKTVSAVRASRGKAKQNRESSECRIAFSTSPALSGCSSEVLC